MSEVRYTKSSPEEAHHRWGTYLQRRTAALWKQRFGGAFSLARMSWIKPSFLWMMYRSGWASKASQERVLAIRLRRNFFERVLRASIASTFHADVHGTIDAWRAAVAASDVRLQWDPDHSPSGTPLARKAIQLGLRGAVLAEYARAALEILDMTPFVLAERRNAVPLYERLSTPIEHLYTPLDGAAASAIGLDALDTAAYR